MEKHRVLLIEDEDESASALAACLPCLTFVRVSKMRDAFRELFVHMSRPFSAVVVDLRLPDSKGVITVSEVKSRIQKLWPELDVPVIVVTGMNPQEAPDVTILGRGAEKVLRKPIDPKELRAALIAAISEKQGEAVFSSLENILADSMNLDLKAMDEALRKRKSDPPSPPR